MALSLLLLILLSLWVRSSDGVGALRGEVSRGLISHVTAPLLGLPAAWVASVDTPILALGFPDPWIPQHRRHGHEEGYNLFILGDDTPSLKAVISQWSLKHGRTIP